jgi:hypothetical protein
MSYPITYSFVEFNIRHVTSTPFSKIAPHNSSFLNDVVVDVERRVAYISDAQAVDGAIIVVDMEKHTSARFSSAATQRDPSYVSHIYVEPRRCGASENYDRTSIPQSPFLSPFHSPPEKNAIHSLTHHLNSLIQHLSLILFSWRFHNDKNKHLSPQLMNFSAFGLYNVELPTGTDGIALSPSTDYLYFCALQSLNLYRIPTASLRSLLPSYADTLARSSEDISGDVSHVGVKSSAADGMTFDADGNLYSGAIADPDHTVFKWNPELDRAAQNIASNQLWADTFAFNGSSLAWVANNLAVFFNQPLDTTIGTRNFELVTLDVGAESYMTAQKDVVKKCSRDDDAEEVRKYRIALWCICAALVIAVGIAVALVVYSTKAHQELRSLRHSRQWAGLTHQELHKGRADEAEAAKQPKGNQYNEAGHGAMENGAGGIETARARKGTTVVSENISIGDLY